MNNPNQNIEWMIRGARRDPSKVKLDYMPLTEKHKNHRHVLGIELPFDWCLVKGSVLRDMQRQLHEAQQTAALRLRMCANLQKELLRKEAR